MNVADLRKKSDADLQKLLNENREKVRELRFKLASRQLKDVRVLRKTKRLIARIITVMSETPTQSDKK